MMIITHRFCGIIRLRVISSLVVDQHLDQLVVHDLHVHLQPANDGDVDNGEIYIEHGLIEYVNCNYVDEEQEEDDANVDDDEILGFH